MTEAKIAPRIDDDGVPWCDAGCPLGDNGIRIAGYTWFCRVQGCHSFTDGICPVAVKRMAVENEAWRDGHFKWNVCGVLLVDGDKFDTIDDAVDALLAEREESNA